jgi:hypothetical protein
VQFSSDSQHQETDESCPKIREVWAKPGSNQVLLEPGSFFYLDPSDEHDERLPLPRCYISNLDKKADSYEGEAEEWGKAYGRGIKITEFDDLITITEGFSQTTLIGGGC